MTEETDGDDRAADEPTTERSTAPQSPYTAKQIGIGALIAAVGIAVTFGIPLAAFL